MFGTSSRDSSSPGESFKCWTCFLWDLCLTRRRPIPDTSVTSAKMDMAVEIPSTLNKKYDTALCYCLLLAGQLFLPNVIRIWVVFCVLLGRVWLRKWHILCEYQVNFRHHWVVWVTIICSWTIKIIQTVSHSNIQPSSSGSASRMTKFVPSLLSWEAWPPWKTTLSLPWQGSVTLWPGWVARVSWGVSAPATWLTRHRLKTKQNSYNENFL